MPKLPWQIEIGILNEWIGALLPTVMPYEYNSIISRGDLKNMLQKMAGKLLDKKQKDQPGPSLFLLSIETMGNSFFQSLFTSVQTSILEFERLRTTNREYPGGSCVVFSQDFGGPNQLTYY